MKREIEIGSGTRLCVLIVGVVCALVWFSAVTTPLNLHAAIGLTALTIVLAPFLVLKQYDLFSPWSIVMLGVITGCVNPAVATSLSWPDAGEIEVHSLLGKDPSYFIYPGMILLMGLICLGVGYFLVPTKIVHKYSMGREVSTTRLYFIVAILGLVSILSTAAFVKFSGGGSDKISGKRNTIRTLDVSSDKEFSQYGYLRTASEVSRIGFLILFTLWAAGGRKLSHSQIIVLTLLFLPACLLPFYASNRAPIVWLFLSAMGIMYYTHQRNLVPKFAILCGLTFGLVILLSVLRVQDAEYSEEFQKIGKHVVFNRNGPELAKTAHIINNVPEKLEFQYGKTIAVWFIAPIPRELLPGKPLIHYGPIIGRRIYGNNVSGVPPGLVAEMYLNFHIPGVILGCLMFGWFMRKLYEFIFAIEGEIAVIVPIYLFAFLEMPYKALASSLGSGIICFVNLAIALFIIYFLTVARKPQIMPVPNPQTLGARYPV